MQWKAMHLLLVALLPFSAAAAWAASSYSYAIDPAASRVDAKVSFIGLGNKKVVFPAVRGNGSLSPTKTDQIALNVTIDATQLKADDSLTTKRLKGKDFFHVQKYPTVRFEGKNLTMSTATSGVVRGSLTARGVTRPLALNVSFSIPPAKATGKETIRLTGVTTINRKDFGMDSYALIVGKKVTITISARLQPG